MGTQHACFPPRRCAPTRPRFGTACCAGAPRARSQFSPPWVRCRCWPRRCRRCTPSSSAASGWWSRPSSGRGLGRRRGRPTCLRTWRSTSAASRCARQMCGPPTRLRRSCCRSCSSSWPSGRCGSTGWRHASTMASKASRRTTCPGSGVWTPSSGSSDSTATAATTSSPAFCERTNAPWRTAAERTTATNPTSTRPPPACAHVRCARPEASGAMT
mmetsp:Transcript_13909/g.39726  ORF Transcript_13909/g.39726 Transcript_13909/m.39726 type:complete len:215 (-) Transcript_13909:173-817(-)